jgi:DNA-binding beta-propeller fold protein YncE
MNSRKTRVLLRAKLVVLLLVTAVALMTSGRVWAAAPSQGSVTPHTGWLYVLDTEDGGYSSRVLLVDPSTSEVMQTYKAGYRPDMVLSPDGSRLYVASDWVNPSTQLLQGFLETYDTNSGKLIGKAANPDMLTSTVPIYRTRMAISPSGRYIYMLKDHNTVETVDFYVTAFDTSLGRVLRDHVSIPECNAVLLPTSRDLTLYVGCMDSAYVREIGLSDSDEPQMNESLPVKGFTLMNRWGAMFLMPNEKGIGLIARDSSGLVLDRSSGTVQNLSKLLSTGKLTGMQSALVSRNRSDAYFAAGESEHDTFEWYDQVVRLDLTTLAVKATSPTSLPFFSVTLSGDGSTLYTLNPERATMTAIDSSSLRELRRMSRIGQTPIFAIPVP